MPRPVMIRFWRHQAARSCLVRSEVAGLQDYSLIARHAATPGRCISDSFPSMHERLENDMVPILGGESSECQTEMVLQSFAADRKSLVVPADEILELDPNVVIDVRHLKSNGVDHSLL